VGEEGVNLGVELHAFALDEVDRLGELNAHKVVLDVISEVG
jgi:hypothetical protein